MNILFVIDKIELKYFEFNDLVTNFWLIKEFLSRGENVYITTNNWLYLKESTAYTTCFESYLKDENIFYNKEGHDLKIDDFNLVMFRPDPPVDNDYINATYILDFVKRAKIINNSRAIRNFNEKLHTTLFSEYMPDHIVTASREKIEEFLKEKGEIILKPLNKCFGSGVMYLHQGDPNTRTIINAMTNDENSVVMVQKFIPAVRYGDKRVLTLGGTVLDESVMKLPTSDDFKFNTHNDNFVKKGVLTEEERSNFTNVAKKLNSMGIYMAGLDVVDGQIIEINVTSPCYFIKEINNNFCTHIEKKICDFILSGTKELKIPEMNIAESYQYRTEIV
jgi:glutathione synthase